MRDYRLLIRGQKKGAKEKEEKRVSGLA